MATAGFYAAFLVLPFAYAEGWNVDPFGLEYLFILIGEIMLGVISGFYISMLFAAFSSAGQFFTYQMGFGASEVYDALSQIENPLMGQYLNLIALVLFLQTGGFQKLFLTGILNSFQSLNAFTLVAHRGDFLTFLLRGLSKLFFDAMVIALPMVGTLFLIAVCMGILSKAAPQMNLLSEGFPITILLPFFLCHIVEIVINCIVNLLCAFPRNLYIKGEYNLTTFVLWYSTCKVFRIVFPIKFGCSRAVGCMF